MLRVLALFLAGEVRGSGASTLPQMAETCLGPKARPLISLCIVVAWMGILAAQFSALEQVLISLTGWPPAFCLGLAFALIAMHSLGGQAAIMRLDSLQSLVMIAGLVIVLAWLWVNNPAWTSGVAIEAVNDSFGYRELVYYLLIVGGNYLVCPMLFGRFFSARDARTARRGGLYAAFGLAL